MADEIDFRLAEPMDAQNVLGLLKQLQKESDTFLVDSDLSEITPDIEAKNIQLINHSYRNLMALAVLGDRPVGIVTVTAVDESVGEVGVAVLADYQGYTLGTNLVELAIDWAKTYSQLTKLTLTVFEENTPARHIYEKLGFKTVKIYQKDERKRRAMALDVTV